jgi:multicomponent Na+:H+ antiporter subunit E
LASTLVHAAVFAALWWALTGGAASTWILGAPVVVAATAASRRLWPRDNGWWSPLALVRFVAFFLRESIRGGVDVARRAFDPALPLQPALLELRSRLPPGPAEVLLVDVMSLLPGTLSVDLNGRTILLHVLDERAPVEAELRVLEGYIAAMFRIPLDGEGPAP